MNEDAFYFTNNMTVTLEWMINEIDSLEEFEEKFPAEFLTKDDHVCNFLKHLLWKYDQKPSLVSENARLHTSYVGNIANGKKRNPSRDALISICLTIGTTVEEIQYLLKYAGQAPLVLYSRCIVCRIDEDGALVGLEEEDCPKVVKYLAA